MKSPSQSDAAPTFLMESSPGPETWINGEKHLYFAGTSYYCLHGHPLITEAAIEGLKTYGMNSATATVSYGTTPLLLEAEKKVAEFFGTDDAAIFASGYLSSMVGMLALSELKKFDVIFIDQLCHFSSRDAAAVTTKPIVTFDHLDPQSLEVQLSTHLQSGQKPLVVTDGVFVLFGNVAPIPEYLALIERYQGAIWIDDAHGAGVIGPNARGTKDYYQLDSDRIYWGATLAKAFGSFGGAITGNQEFIDAVRQVSVLKGASTPPIPALAATVAAIELFISRPWLKERLHRNALRLREGLSKLGFDVAISGVPIVAWDMGGSSRNESIFNALLEKKTAIQITHYGGAGTQVLRAVVSSEHTPKQIDQLLLQLKELQ